MLSDSKYYSYGSVNNNGDSCPLAGTAVTVLTNDVRELEAVVQDGTSRRLLVLLVSRPGQAEQARLDAGS
jgi:hypothetical protein